MVAGRRRRERHSAAGAAVASPSMTVRGRPPNRSVERAALGRRARRRRRHRRGRPWRVGRSVDGRRRDPAQGVAGQRCARLEAAHRAEREKLFDRIAGWCTAWAVGSASQGECDELGMAEAQRVATRRAVAGLGVVPDAAVSDGLWNFVSPTVARVEMRVKADRDCLSVAAASILAKVVRDREMRELVRPLPELVVRLQQGLPVSRPQGRPPGLRSVGDPPPHVDLHGPLRAVARHRARLPPRPTDPVLSHRRIRKSDLRTPV